jgi:hypothetical protein
MDTRWIVLIVALLAAGPGLTLSPAAAQRSSALDTSRNVDAILRAFNKKKHAVKEKFGVRVEKFKEVRSEAVVKDDVREYAGIYLVPQLLDSVTLRVDAAGKVGGTGLERAPGGTGTPSRFTLRDVKIEGALLTATRVYEGGRTEPFVGLFIRRTDFDSPADPGKTRFGLGVLQKAEVGGVQLDTLFYERMRS